MDIKGLVHPNIVMIYSPSSLRCLWLHTFLMWIFFSQKRIVLLQKAFVNPPKPCGLHYEGWVYFKIMSLPL